jgi:hypothetical protein
VNSSGKFEFTCSNAVSSRCAPFAVEAGDAGAQGADRVLEIGLLGHKRVVFGLHLPRVLLGAQVHRTQRLALPLESLDVGLDRVGRGHRLGVRAQLRQKLGRCRFEVFRNPGDGRIDGFSRGFRPGLDPCAGFAGVRGAPLGLTLGGDGFALGALRLGKPASAAVRCRVSGLCLRRVDPSPFPGDLARLGFCDRQFAPGGLASFLQLGDPLSCGFEPGRASSRSRG